MTSKRQVVISNCETGNPLEGWESEGHRVDDCGFWISDCGMTDRGCPSTRPVDEFRSSRSGQVVRRPKAKSSIPKSHISHPTSAIPQSAILPQSNTPVPISVSCTTQTRIKYPHAAADQLLAFLGYAAIHQVVLS